MSGHLAYRLVSAAKLAREVTQMIGYFLQKIVYCALSARFMAVFANNLRQTHENILFSDDKKITWYDLKCIR